VPPTFESGVKAYIVGVATVAVNFPINWKDQADVRCEMCEFYSRGGHSCRLNHAIVEYPEKFIGSQCPLNFESTEKENEV
jgi:hypothetical protein